MKRLRWAVVGCVLVAVFGCTPDPQSGSGFTLPEGDATSGKAIFAELQCTACHTVAGVEFGETGEVDDADALVALGGEVGHVVTYGDLVTSIINPSHRFALGYSEDEIKEGESSKMRLYNDEMTVSQLADLVTFLEQHYKLKTYYPTPYVPYY